MAPEHSNYHSKCPDVHYRRLPLSNEPLLKHWLDMKKLSRPLKLSYARLCSKLFLDSDYEFKGSFDASGTFRSEMIQMLQPTPIPSLFDFSSYSKGNMDAPTTPKAVQSARVKRYASKQSRGIDLDTSMPTNYDS